MLLKCYFIPRECLIHLRDSLKNLKLACFGNTNRVFHKNNRTQVIRQKTKDKNKNKTNLN